MGRFTNKHRLKLYLRLLLRAVLFVICVFFLTFILPRFFSLFAPFIFAFLMAYILNPFVSKLNMRTGIPRRLAALILVILVFAIFFSLVGWFIYTIVSEAVSLAINIQSIWNNIASAFTYLNEKAEWLLGYLPGDTETMLTSIMDSIYQGLQSVSKAFLDYILSSTTVITTKVSGVILSSVIFIMSAYFMTAEYNTISGKAKKIIGTRMYAHFCVLKDAVKSAAGGYLKAQLMLALFAFAVMFPALSIYRQEYAALIAVFLAFIDLLPIVGTAAILIPWGIMEALGGNTFKCIFLIILACAFFVARKFAEPKIVGSQTGLHPLAALMSIYVGMKILGIWGAVFGPIVVMTVISIVKAGFFTNAVKDIKDVAYDIASMLRRTY